MKVKKAKLICKCCGNVFECPVNEFDPKTFTWYSDCPDCRGLTKRAPDAGDSSQ